MPRSEILAGIIALQSLAQFAPERTMAVTLCSDNQLFVKNASRDRAWSLTTIHADLYELYWAAFDLLPFPVRVRKVKAHLSELALAGGAWSWWDYAGNHDADCLARRGAALAALSPGDVARIRAVRVLAWRVQSRLAAVTTHIAGLPQLFPMEPYVAEVVATAPVAAYPGLLCGDHDWRPATTGPGAPSHFKCCLCLASSPACRKVVRDTGVHQPCYPVAIWGIGCAENPPAVDPALRAAVFLIGHARYHGSHLLYHMRGIIYCLSCGHCSALRPTPDLAAPCLGHGARTGKGHRTLRRLHLSQPPSSERIWPLSALDAPDDGFIDLAKLRRL